MKKIVELPLVKPLYDSFHFATGSAIVAKNPTIQNYYLNEVMNLKCTKKFLSGDSHPEITIENINICNNPFLEKKWLSLQDYGVYIHVIIRNMLDKGYYVYFTRIDDFYISGKAWYKKRHVIDDGCICGYNQVDKTYCIYAYDEDWNYKKFWAPQSDFEKARKSAYNKKFYGNICGLMAKDDIVEFQPEIVIKNLKQYLDSSLRKYPLSKEGNVFGRVVHKYVSLYIERMNKGLISYENADRNLFRLLYDHKKVMHKRIVKLENFLNLENQISVSYCDVICSINNIKGMYDVYLVNKNYNVLPLISKSILKLEKVEFELLSQLVKDVERVINK